MWSYCETVAFRKNGIFLFNTPPRFLVCCSIKNWFDVSTGVCAGRHQFLICSIFPNESFCQNKNVVSSTERIWKHYDWFYDDLWVVRWSLIARWSIIIPIWNVFNACRFLVKSTSLWTNAKGTIDQMYSAITLPCWERSFKWARGFEFIWVLFWLTSK
jgi:hypothetical protein